MIEKILEKIDKLKVYKAILTSDKHPFTASEVELVSKKAVLAIVQEVAKKYGNTSDNDLTVVSELPSLYPLQPFEEEAIHKVVASVSTKNKPWILCSERLPEESKLVLIYAESTARGGSIRRVAQLHNGFWFVQTASDTLGLIGQYKVIKWAELPEV